MAVRDVRVSVSLSGNGGVGHPSTTHLRGGSAGRSRAYTPTQHPWTLVQSMRPRNRPVTDDFRASTLSSAADCPNSRGHAWIAAPPITQRQGCGPRVLALLLRLLRRCAPGRLYRSTPADPDSRLRRGWQKPRNGSRFGDLVVGWLLRGGPRGRPAGRARAQSWWAGHGAHRADRRHHGDARAPARDARAQRQRLRLRALSSSPLLASGCRLRRLLPRPQRGSSGRRWTGEWRRSMTNGTRRLGLSAATCAPVRSLSPPPAAPLSPLPPPHLRAGANSAAARRLPPADWCTGCRRDLRAPRAAAATSKRPAKPSTAARMPPAVTQRRSGLSSGAPGLDRPFSPPPPAVSCLFNGRMGMRAARLVRQARCAPAEEPSPAVRRKRVRPVRSQPPFCAKPPATWKTIALAAAGLTHPR